VGGEPPDRDVELLGRYGGAAGRVDLEQHSLDASAAPRLPDGANQVIGAHRTADRSSDLHDRDPPSVGQRDESVRAAALRDHLSMLVGSVGSMAAGPGQRSPALLAASASCRVVVTGCPPTSMTRPMANPSSQPQS